MKVLVIEDSDKHRQAARDTLEEHELTVLCTFDEAMEVLKDGPVHCDVVLTDLMMPMSPTMLRPELYDPAVQVPYGFVIALKAALAGARHVAVVTDTNHHEGAISAALDYLGHAYYSEGFEPNFNINGAVCMFVHAPFITKTTTITCPSCQGSGRCRHCQDESGGCTHCDGASTCGTCLGTGKYDDEEETDLKDWGQVLKDLTAISSSL